MKSPMTPSPTPYCRDAVSATAPTFATLNPGVNASAKPAMRARSKRTERGYSAALLRFRYARVFLRLPQSCIEHQVPERFGDLS